MKSRPKKTTIKRSGKSGFSINFSEKDGKAVADRMRTGGSLVEILFGKLPEKQN
ncbi:MAG: hypothetical protein M0R32_10510 [Candidatus Cloacimonetes bacterium]|jgi:hypothetical protein|nr:hypothetical protein [Candidatus Cloacimonadota bacterium]